MSVINCYKALVIYLVCVYERTVESAGGLRPKNGTRAGLTIAQKRKGEIYMYILVRTNYFRTDNIISRSLSLFIRSLKIP